MAALVETGQSWQVFPIGEERSNAQEDLKQSNLLNHKKGATRLVLLSPSGSLVASVWTGKRETQVYVFGPMPEPESPGQIAGVKFGETKIFTLSGPDASISFGEKANPYYINVVNKKPV